MIMRLYENNDYWGNTKAQVGEGQAVRECLRTDESLVLHRFSNILLEAIPLIHFPPIMLCENYHMDKDDDS